jgi:hypothetical protein
MTDEPQQEVPPLKARLRALDKTPAGLALRLGLEQDRSPGFQLRRAGHTGEIYPVVNGELPMPQEWIELAAEYMEWPVQTLLDAMRPRMGEGNEP